MTDLTNPTEDTDVISYTASNDKNYELQTLKDTIPLMQSPFATDRRVAEFAQTVFRYKTLMCTYFNRDFVDPMDPAGPKDLQSIELYKVRAELSKYYRWTIDALLKELTLNSTIEITLKGMYFKLYKTNWVFDETIEGV